MKLIALRGFPLKKGVIVKEGDTFETDNYHGRGLVIARLAKRAEGGVPAPGTYNRRDMRAAGMQAAQTASRQDAITANASESTDETDREGEGRSNRGKRS